MNKTLVACFSPTGNTLAVAKIIAALTNGELFEIRPGTPYSNADLDWHNSASRSSVEMKDPASRPEIAGQVQDLTTFKTVFLGFPIWWYEPPHIIYTFLENYDFSGKAIIPFVTSGSSGLGRIPEHLQKACPAAHWLPGMRFAQHPEAKTIENWVSEHQDWKKI